MSCTAESRDQPGRSFSTLRTMLVLLVTISLLSVTLRQVDTSPLPDDLVQEYQSLLPENSTMDSSSTMDDSSTENSTETNTDVYVIKAVVYEIGILTDTDNTTSESTERHEKVDISLYDPPLSDDEFS